MKVFSIVKTTILRVQLKSWENFLNVQGGNLNILGYDLKVEQVDSMIRTFLIIGLSGIAVGIVGVVFYGGYVWITAGDSDEKLQRAKKIMKGVIAAIFTVAGFMLTLGVISWLAFDRDITEFNLVDILT